MPIPFVTVQLKVERIVRPANLDNLVNLLGELGLSGSAQEQLWVLALDGQNNIRQIHVANIGSYHDTFVSIPTVLSPVLLSASDRFIVAHNHPNGKPNPTQDDIELTRRIDAAANVLDMEFDDHLIVTARGAWVSMRALGHLR